MARSPEDFLIEAIGNLHKQLSISLSMQSQLIEANGLIVKDLQVSIQLEM